MRTACPRNRYWRDMDITILGTNSGSPRRVDGRASLRSADAGRPVADGPVRRACLLLVFVVDRTRRCGRGHAGGRLARVAHLPDRAAGVVSDEECTVLGDSERGGPSPYLGAPFARRPEAGHEILVVARRFPVLERHPHHLVAGRRG